MNIKEKLKNLLGEQKVYLKKYALTFTLILYCYDFNSCINICNRIIC